MTTNLTADALQDADLKAMFHFLDNDAYPEPNDTLTLARALRVTLHTDHEWHKQPDIGWRIIYHAYVYLLGDKYAFEGIRRHDGILTAQVQEVQ